MIPLFKVAMSPKAQDPVIETLYSGYIGQGPKVAEFEKALSETFNNPYVLTTSAGTHALHLALRIADVGPGDRGGGGVMATFEAVMRDVEQDDQDRRDGAALRRLREAALYGHDSPFGPSMHLVHIGWDDPESYDPGGYSVEVDGDRAYGDTIAEAADKCREVLT